MYMLDTNICIYIIKKRPMSVLEKFDELSHDQICISVITFAELQYGVKKSASKKLNQKIVNEFVSRLIILPWDKQCANIYGNLRARLEKKGNPIGNMDLMIASHALSQKHTLVSNNIREFRRFAS